MNEKGFSITETMIGVALVGILAIITLQAAKMLDDTTTYGDSVQSLQALATTVRERLKHADLCSRSIAAMSGLNQNTIDRSLMQTGHQSIEAAIAGLKAGPTANEEVLRAGQRIVGLNLRIDELYLANVVQTAAPDEYGGQIIMSATSVSDRKAIKDRKLKPVVAASVSFRLSGASIAECIGISSRVTMNTCQSMGCRWQTAPLPACDCRTLSSLCPTGQYPTAFSGSTVTCQTLGGS